MSLVARTFGVMTWQQGTANPFEIVQKSKPVESEKPVTKHDGVLWGNICNKGDPKDAQAGVVNAYRKAFLVVVSLRPPLSSSLVQMSSQPALSRLCHKQDVQTSPSNVFMIHNVLFQ